MSRTNARYEQKAPNTDGRIVLGAQDFELMTGGGTSSFVRNAKGSISQNIPASQTDILIAELSGVIFRTGQIPFLQEQFGTAAGVAGPTGVANTSDPDAQAGVPPETGIVSITPVLGFVPKGIKFLDITLKYLIGTNPLALHTIGLSKSVFTNNAAIVVTDLLANAANGLATAAQVNPYVTKIAISSPVFTVSDLSDLIIELDVTTPAGGTYQLFGADLHCQFNYN